MSQKTTPPTEAQKLAQLRGMLLVSTGSTSGNPYIIPPSSSTPYDGSRPGDDPDENTVVYHGDGGVWDDDADDDD